MQDFFNFVFLQKSNFLIKRRKIISSSFHFILEESFETKLKTNIFLTFHTSNRSAIVNAKMKRKETKTIIIN